MDSRYALQTAVDVLKIVAQAGSDTLLQDHEFIPSILTATYNAVMDLNEVASINSKMSEPEGARQ